MAPKKTPQPVVTKIREATEKAVRDKAVIEAIEKLGEEVRFLDRPELVKDWARESEEIKNILTELAKKSIKIGELRKPPEHHRERRKADDQSH